VHDTELAMTKIDLDAYLARIGWPEARAPETSRGALERLLDHHMRAIPFENLDVLLGRPPRLDLDSLQRKLVAGHRGGYCFEHATLMAAVLERLGFAVARHSARVTMRSPRHLSPRTHMFLTVTLDDEHLMLDPGFGGQAARVPVPIGGAAGDYVFHSEDGVCVLRLRGDELWVSTLAVDLPIDFELANHYTATHPSSPFTQRLMMSVLTGDGRVGVMNRDVTLHRNGELVSTRKLGDRDELRALVHDLVGVNLPEVTGMRVASEPGWDA
jgi:N-hydroxyarylamine O-acetyltransferase